MHLRNREQVPGFSWLSIYLQERNRIEHLMFTARKASVEDCGLIREMACVAFPDTYKTILSPEQLDYMMEWMYSPETSGGRWPKGTYITSPTRTALPAAISLSSPKQTTSTSCKNLHPAPIPGCARGELPLPQGYRTHQTAPPGSLPDGAPRKSP